jgi:hypothetical protein
MSDLNEIPGWHAYAARKEDLTDSQRQALDTAMHAAEQLGVNTSWYYRAREGGNSVKLMDVVAAAALAVLSSLDVAP